MSAGGRARALAARQDAAPHLEQPFPLHHNTQVCHIFKPCPAKVQRAGGSRTFRLCLWKSIMFFKLCASLTDKAPLDSRSYRAFR